MSEQCRVQLLGVQLQLTAEPHELEPLRYGYSRFLVDSGESPDGWLRLDSANGRITSDRHEWPLHAGIEPIEQLYPRFLERFYDAVGDHAILHAGVVAPPGDGCVLLAAPAGHGKSTLTLELARRGWTFFSDDFAPLDLDRGSVAPFPRAVGIVPGSAATPSPFGEAIGSHQPRLFGKQLIEPSCGGRIEVAPLSERRPLKHLFVLVGDQSHAPTVEFVFDAHRADELRRQLPEMSGVKVLQESVEGDLVRITIETDPAQATAQQLNRWVTDPAVLYCSKRWSERDGYAGTPDCSPLSRLHAAEAIVKELLNRRPGGALMRRFDENPVELLIELAAALKNTQCWSLQVGPLEATADLVARKVETVPGGIDG